MKEFFRNELKTLYAKTQLRQYETISAMPDAEFQFTALLDALERVCQYFKYIPEQSQKAIILERMLTDEDFIGFNAKIISKWFNQAKDKYFVEEAHKSGDERAAPAVTYDELTPETKQAFDAFLRGLQSDNAGFKKVPGVTQKEIDDIKIEDLEEREGRKAIPVNRPEWIVGDKCSQCDGNGKFFTCDPPVENICEACGGVGEVNLVRVNADTEAEARKAYRATFKKQL